MNKLIKQAFTLIELLVVIAIIGILSGLIVVSMGGMTDKANIAKSQVFSNSLRNSLLLSIVAEYKFDGVGKLDGEVADGTYADDTWGSYDGIITGHEPIVRTGTNCVSGSCLEFIPANQDFVDCGVVTQTVNINKLTKAFWMKVYGAGDNAAAGYFSRYQSNSIYSYPNIVGIVVTDGTSGAVNPGYNLSQHLNEWHFYVLTYDGDKALNQLSFYIDGVNKNNSTASGNILNTANHEYIGKYYSGGYFANAAIDEARLYNASMPAYKIKEQYYVGLNNLLINGSIAREEYLSRLNNYASNN